MNKTIKRFGLILGAAALLGVPASAAFAQTKGYIEDSAAKLTYKNAYGQCWRTGYWTSAMATKE
ncbi:MAG: OmpA family protein, partial [Pseudomonadota bacterium]